LHHQEDALLEMLMVRMVALQYPFFLVSLQKVPGRQALAMTTIFWCLTIALVFGSLASSLKSAPVMVSGLFMLLSLSMWTWVLVTKGRVDEK
jgi:hypothetical protein